MPYAISIRRVEIREIRTVNGAKGSGYFVLTFTLLAVVSILMQRIAIVTEAHVRADSIATLMLTAAIVGRTLVDVSKKHRSESRALYSLI